MTATLAERGQWVRYWIGVLCALFMAACGQPDGLTAEDRFAESLLACRVDDFSARLEGVGEVYYTILGRDQNDCRIEMVFVKNPNPALVDQPLVIRLREDRTPEKLRATIAACLEGRPLQTGQETCDGPLLTAMGYGLGGAGPSMAEGDFSESGCGTDYIGRPPARYRMRDQNTGLWGFLDETGTWAIKPTFLQAYGFSEGLAPVLDGETWHVINTKGDVAIAAIGDARDQSRSRFKGRNLYSSPISPFQDTCARYTNTKGVFYLSRDGQLWLDKATPEMLAAAETVGGTVSDIDEFGHGLASFQIDVEEFGKLDPKGYIDGSGRVAIAAQFANTTPFDRVTGLAAVGVAEGPDSPFSDGWIYINAQGEKVLPKDDTRYKSASAFSGGYASVRTNRKYFYIDGEGQPISDNQFQNTGLFSDGMAYVRGNDDVWGWIDDTGTRRFTEKDLKSCDTDWGFYNRFQDGLALVLIAKDETGCGEGYASNVGGGDSAYDNAEFAYVDKTGAIQFRESQISAP